MDLDKYITNYNSFYNNNNTKIGQLSRKGLRFNSNFKMPLLDKSKKHFIKYILLKRQPI